MTRYLNIPKPIRSGIVVVEPERQPQRENHDLQLP